MFNLFIFLFLVTYVNSLKIFKLEKNMYISLTGTEVKSIEKYLF